MTKKPNRTRPLDRDGDGHDGGSLPGNETAPMARAADRPTDNGAKVIAAGGFKPDTPREEIETELRRRATEVWGEDTFDVEWKGDKAYAKRRDPNAEEQARIEQDNADRGAREDANDDQPTFTPEEIAAGARPVADQDGEVETPAADTATRIDDDDPLVQIETETAPIAVRVRELKILVNARRLYKSEQGYSENHGAPYIEDATVQAWIKAGLAEDVPSAGNHGGVRLLPEARRQLNLITRGQVAA